MLAILVSLVSHWAIGPSVRAKIDSPGSVWLASLLALVSFIVLLPSGIGYLDQKRFAGRVLGNIYACVALLAGLVSLRFLAPGLRFAVVIASIYPILTLILLNTTYKKNLSN